MENYNLDPSRVHRMAKMLLRIHGQILLMEKSHYYELLCQRFTDAADRWIATFTDPIERACAQTLASGYDDYIDDKSGRYDYDCVTDEPPWFKHEPKPPTG